MSQVFSCRRCGHCCMGRGGIVLGPTDRARLARHLGLDEASMLEQCAVLHNGKYTLRSKELCEQEVAAMPEAARELDPDAVYRACLFFSPGQGCLIHEARPDVCRAWPFFRGNIVDAVSLEMARADCPGISRNADHSEFARQGLAYLRAHGLNHSDSPANALRVLCEKDGSGHETG